jgi:hypothetical protein
MPAEADLIGAVFPVYSSIKDLAIIEPRCADALRAAIAGEFERGSQIPGTVGSNPSSSCAESVCGPDFLNQGAEILGRQSRSASSWDLALAGSTASTCPWSRSSYRHQGAALLAGLSPLHTHRGPILSTFLAPVIGWRGLFACGSEVDAFCLIKVAPLSVGLGRFRSCPAHTGAGGARSQAMSRRIPRNTTPAPGANLRAR